MGIFIRYKQNLVGFTRFSYFLISVKVNSQKQTALVSVWWWKILARVGFAVFPLPIVKSDSTESPLELCVAQPPRSPLSLVSFNCFHYSNTAVLGKVFSWILNSLYWTFKAPKEKPYRIYFSWSTLPVTCSLTSKTGIRHKDKSCLDYVLSLWSMRLAVILAQNQMISE